MEVSRRGRPGGKGTGRGRSRLDRLIGDGAPERRGQVVGWRVAAGRRPARRGRQPQEAPPVDRPGGNPLDWRPRMVPRQQRGPDFLRLANGPSALYPKGSEERRLLDAMLLAAPR